MQTDLCAEDLWLQDLAHDLNDAIQCHIPDGKEGIPSQQMDDRPGPKDEAAAEKGQGIDDGNEDTQKERIGGLHHQHSDDGNGEGEAHQDELGFDLAPAGGFQLIFGCVYRKSQQRCQMFLIHFVDEITVFGKKVGGDQCHEEGNEEIGNAT